MMASIGPRNYMWFPSVRNFNSHSIIAGKLLVIIGDYYGALWQPEFYGVEWRRYSSPRERPNVEFSNVNIF